MSHSMGEVVIEDATVGYCEYNGTSDVMKPTIRKTAQEVWDKWRQPDTAKCTCGQPSTPVILYSNYGDGFHWPSTACLTCMAITGIRIPYAYDDPSRMTERGHPYKKCDRDDITYDIKPREPA